MIERHKTGLTPPDDFEMMDLEAGEQGNQIGQNQTDTASLSSEGSVSKANGGGTISGRNKTRRGFGGIFTKKVSRDFHVCTNVM